jgi:hypothetical protein
MDLNDAIEAIQQPRSRYQLEQFVIGQHDTVIFPITGMKIQPLGLRLR